MGLRPYLVVFSCLAVIAAASCGGKTAAIGPDGGSPASSGSGSGSSSGVHGGSGSGSGSSSGAPIGDCSADISVTCSGGATGFACPAGTSPAASDPTISCSTPVTAGNGEDLYCCFVAVIGGSTCTPDDQVTAQCADPTSYGYICTAGDNPTTYDSSLDCSSPVPHPDGVHDDFCCTYAGGSSSGSSGGPVPAGCTADSTLACTPGAIGLACAIGDNPETEVPGLSCSTPVLATGEDDYCCFSGGVWSPTTCEPDDALTSVCPDPTSYGYVCASGDDPTTYDSSLNCSVPTPDADGVHDDFCCTYQ